jgi:hypothetical protein
MRKVDYFFGCIIKNRYSLGMNHAELGNKACVIQSRPLYLFANEFEWDKSLLICTIYGHNWNLKRAFRQRYKKCTECSFYSKIAKTFRVDTFFWLELRGTS